MHVRSTRKSTPALYGRTEGLQYLRKETTGPPLQATVRNWYSATSNELVRGIGLYALCSATYSYTSNTLVRVL